LQFVGRRSLQCKSHAHAAAERGQLLGSQAFEQAAITGEHDGEQDVAVETGRR
jgi:hypothetical protein